MVELAAAVMHYVSFNTVAPGMMLAHRLWTCALKIFNLMVASPTRLDR
jgi:hypothetical protein